MKDGHHAGWRLAKLGLLAAVVSRVFSRLVGILLVVLLAREATTDTVATYGYLLGTATLVAALTDLGVAAVAGREVAAGRLQAGAALRASLGPQAASLVAAAGVTVGIAVGIGPPAMRPVDITLTVLFVVVSGLVNLWSELIRATGRVILEGALQMIGAMALVAGGVAVVHNGGDATDLLLVVLLKEVTLLVIVMYLVRPRRYAPVSGWQMLGQSAWLAVAGSALIVLWRQGTFVLGSVGGLGALATYVVASRFLDAGVTLAHTAGFGLVPGVSALAADGAAVRRAARRYIGFGLGLGAVIAVAGFLLAGPLTVVPFGDRWAGAVPAVRIIALSGLPILLVFVAAPFLVARRQARLLAAAAMSGCAAALALSAVLVINDPGPSSVAVGTLVGAAVCAAVLLAGLRDLLFCRYAPTPLVVENEASTSPLGATRGQQ